MNPELLQAKLKQTIGRAGLRFSRPPACEAIELCLFDPDVLEGPLTHEEAQAVVAEPAYWSFCWASGQVLASYILANPALVKDQTILDFGSGSGVVAIAAAKAGARQVFACDCDPDARSAIELNARQNAIIVTNLARLEDCPVRPDLITAADVLYDRDNFPLLDLFCAQANSVLLADSRVRQLPSENFGLLTTQEARTWPDLNEFEEFNQVRIYISGHAY